MEKRRDVEKAVIYLNQRHHMLFYSQSLVVIHLHVAHVLLL